LLTWRLLMARKSSLGAVERTALVLQLLAKEEPESPWFWWRLPSHPRGEIGACDMGMTRRRRTGRCGCSSSAARSSPASRGSRRCST